MDIKLFAENKLDWPFSDSPQFDQDLWLKFYRNCFLIGARFGAMFNGGENLITGINEKNEKLIRFLLLSNMSYHETANHKAFDCYAKNYADVEEVVTDMKGWRSYHASHTGTETFFIRYLDPVSLGFIAAANGTTDSAVLGGPYAWSVITNVDRLLLNLQETRILYHTKPAGLFTEQYVAKFKDTFVPYWCKKENSRLFFGTSAVCGWNENPASFEKVIRHKKVVKRLYRDRKMNLYLGHMESCIRDYAGSVPEHLAPSHFLSFIKRIVTVYDREFADIVGFTGYSGIVEDYKKDKEALGWNDQIYELAYDKEGFGWNGPGYEPV